MSSPGHLAVGALVAVLASACGGAMPSASTPSSSEASTQEERETPQPTAPGGSAPAATVPGPVVAHAEAGDGSGNEALVGGTVTVRDGCLLLSGEYPVVWPYGTTWEAEQKAVRLPDGQLAALGDRVEGGGGFFDPGDLREELAEPLSGCPDEHGEIAVFNAREGVVVVEADG